MVTTTSNVSGCRTFLKYEHSAASELLATAAHLSGHDDESSETWTQAYQTYLAMGDVERAVRCAFWLGLGFVQRGQMAHGGGWLAGARSLADEHGLDCVEGGHLLVPAALITMGAGDYAGCGVIRSGAGNRPAIG